MIALRDAATLILLRGDPENPAVLMGQRKPNAAFMPAKFVFPGGTVDPQDHAVPLLPMAQTDHAALTKDSQTAPDALAAAAIRETWEETGLILGRPATWDNPPQNWRDFAASGHRPDGAALRFFFRAMTPPGQTRRFDARFFVADATDLASDPDDFSKAQDELTQLHWVLLSDSGKLDLPRITTIVLDHLRQTIRHGAPAQIPYLRRDDPGEIAPLFRV
jgi:8-oxo-dGTP pyrophosphatase MutT (NUDIX family)